MAGAPISSSKFWAYSSSNSSQGINSAIIIQRLSADNFPSKGNSKFSGAIEDSFVFPYICSCRISARVF
uniref:Uncharacterized protein n=1 Tax=Microcystis aeruginosa (strain PCC 7806) TaxID=267872 RepID=A8YJR3_MICA7|nr:unnamed protein product [Microcystis aeruginosa PCC 7806]